MSPRQTILLRYESKKAEKFYARTFIDGKAYPLGHFMTLQEAEAAVSEASAYNTKEELDFLFRPKHAVPYSSTPLGKLRQAAGLTQWELAKKMGLHRTAICSWEYGYTGITPEHARMLAELYHTTAEEIRRLVREARERYERY